MKVLIDTNILSIVNLIEILNQKGFKIFVAKATKDREITGTSFESQVYSYEVAPETFVFGESSFPISFRSNDKLLRIIKIISNGSFPTGGDLTDKQRNQLRDALIFESSIIRNCDYFCSNDSKAFINHGKREKLENEFGVKIRKSDEMIAEFST